MIDKLVRKDRLMTYSGKPDQQEKPASLFHGTNAVLHPSQPTDVVVTPATASKKGWVVKPTNRLILQGRSGAQKLVPLLPRVGSLYGRGASSDITALELTDLEVGDGARLRISVESASPEVMEKLGELFEVLATVAEQGESTEGYIEITDPDDSCLCVQELKKN